MLRLCVLLLGLVWLCADPAPLRAQTLEESAAAYDQAVLELQTAKRTALTQAQNAYLAVLDQTLKQPGIAPETSTLLKAEREGIVRGLLAPANPVGLPPDVAAARRVFLNAAGKSALEFSKGKKAVDDGYLKTLAVLAKQAKSKSSPAGMAAKVAAEKRRVTTGN